MPLVKAIVSACLLAAVLTAACSCTDENLTLVRRDHVSDVLRLDGYYYSPYSSDAMPHGMTVFFLYRNGVVRGNDNETHDGDATMVESDFLRGVRTRCRMLG